MAREWVIPVLELTEEAFAPYGRIVRIPEETAPFTGPGWECWYGFQALECRWPIFMGAVRTRLRPIEVDTMERHTHTFEYLYPHGHELVQPVGPPLELEDEAARPDPEHVRAFRVPIGWGIIMHPGTWHSAAFPVSQDCTYGFANMEPDFAYTPGWIPFQGDATVRVEGPYSPEGAA